jgi:hypothetical protein
MSARFLLFVAGLFPDVGDVSATDVRSADSARPS